MFSRLSKLLLPAGAILAYLPAGLAAAPAGEGPSPPGAAEARIVRRALERDPALEAARAALEAARARRAVALSPEDPELRGGLGRNYRGRSGGATETYDDYEIGLRFFPPNLWQVSALRDRADAEVEVARARLDLLEHRTAREVRGEYFRLRELEADRDFHARREELRGERRRLIREQAMNGRATAAEVARADSRWLEARQAGEELRRQAGRLRRRLEARTGLPDLGPVSTLPRPETGLEEDHAPPEHPEVAVGRWRTRTAEAEYRRSRGETLPWFNHLQVAYGDDDRPGRNEAWSARAAVSVPLFSLVYRPQRAAAAEQLTARTRLRETIAAVEAESAQARADWIEALESHRETGEICRPLLGEIRETLKLMAGDPDIERLAVLNLEESLLETERVLTRSGFEVERARRALEDALGLTIHQGEDD